MVFANKSAKPKELFQNHNFKTQSYYFVNVSSPKPSGYLHHNQISDVIIEKSDYYIKNLIVMHKTWVFGPFKLGKLWTG